MPAQHTNNELLKRLFHFCRYESWRESRSQQEEAARYKKNPDEFRSKMEQMEAARLRLQRR